MAKLFSQQIPEDVPASMRAEWLKAKKVDAESWKDEEGDSLPIVSADLDLFEVYEDLMEASFEVLECLPEKSRQYPTWAWGTKIVEKDLELDSMEILEAALGDEAENFDDRALNAMQNALDEWVAKYAPGATMTVVEVDKSIVVMLPFEWWKSAEWQHTKPQSLS